MTHALAIHLHGTPLATVSAARPQVLGVQLALSRGDETGRLSASGMVDGGNGRNDHVTWLVGHPLKVHDTLRLHFAHATQAVDLPEIPHVPEGGHARAVHARPGRAAIPMGLKVTCDGGPDVAAWLDDQREGLLLSWVWHAWNPSRCRMSLSSFSHREALSRAGGKDWFAGHLELGMGCDVRVLG